VKKILFSQTDMMSLSKLFYTDAYKAVQEKTRDILNAQTDFLTSRTARSPRAAGDAIENILQEELKNILGSETVKDYTSDFARRAMGDLAFEDHDGFYYLVDVKTHRSDTDFNMPNLTSVQRPAKLYSDDKNYFCLLLVAYSVESVKVTVKEVRFVPLEFLSWSCLTLGALGWGQIQLANSNRVTIEDKKLRKEWMLELCDRVLEFYPEEILKINERIAYFEEVKKFWQAK
jgi:hypothetical protein